MTEDRDVQALIDRPGLPEDLQVLYRKYPRAEWGTIHTLGSMGRFWISRHDMFRELGGSLSKSVDDLREERIEPMAFARWFAPRFNHFLGDLDGHHQIEDYQYFPMFAAADERLKPGFDLLEEDHGLIHTLLERNADKARAFFDALMAGSDRLSFDQNLAASANALAAMWSG